MGKNTRQNSRSIRKTFDDWTDNECTLTREELEKARKETADASS